MTKDVKIGLEIHGYLQTREKLFCRCMAVRHAAKQDIKPNSFVCAICTGQPGSKPMLPNASAIRKIIEIALMLKCKVNTTEQKKNLVWQRKHYNWPDLPKGYQNTISGAYSVPVAENGIFENARIREIHLEEDPASWNPETGCVDYNRSGLPLAEIVTEPDFSSAEDVSEWLKQLVLTLSYIKAVDRNAGIKADVNVSIGKKSGAERVEIKNINSIESIKKAIEFEIARQEKEGTLRETRRFDEQSGKTTKMREKEESADYRFIPDPDLPVIKIKEKVVKEIRENLPESPQEKLQKLVKKHKIDKRPAEALSKNLEIVEFFESVSEKIPADFALPWVVIELLRVLNWNKKSLEEVDIKPEHFIELLEAVRKKDITELKAKQILNGFVPSSFSIKEKLKGAGRITDKSETEKIIKKVIENNRQAVSDLKEGKKEALNFLLGEVMKESQRRADYKTARDALIKMIG